jgi:hypothetical protein
MAFLHFDSRYVPCGFLIVRDGADPYSNDPADSVLVQTDWDFPGVAQSAGWSLDMVQGQAIDCDHDSTDGTVDCDGCGLSANEFISAARDWLYDHNGESFEGLDEYLLTDR